MHISINTQHSCEKSLNNSKGQKGQLSGLLASLVRFACLDWDSCISNYGVESNQSVDPSICMLIGWG